jgi:hypothetical protein
VRYRRREHGTSVCAQAVDMHRSEVHGGVTKRRRSVQSTLAFKVEAGHVRVFVQGAKLSDSSGPCQKTPTSALCSPCENDSGCASGHEKEPASGDEFPPICVLVCPGSSGLSGARPSVFCLSLHFDSTHACLSVSVTVCHYCVLPRTVDLYLLA